MSIRALVFCAVFAAPAAFAADAPAGKPPAHPGAEHRNAGPCRDDMKKYCGDIKPGDGRMKHCVEENQSKFTPACQQDMAKHRERAEAKHKACEPDMQKFCKDIKPGDGRMVQCLGQHRAELSPACAKDLPSKPRHERGAPEKPKG